GGEGTVDALVEGMGGSKVQVEVTGPLGAPVIAEYGVFGTTAVMEMSAAAGITLVPAELRNPMNTTTYGVGEMIIDAVHKGCRNFIVGIGGSATNDGGIGMLQALGFGILDECGENVPMGGRGLEKIAKITTDGALSKLSECTFNIACDVTNPLCGELGCSAIYGPQKGADSDMVKTMDAWLERYAELVKVVLPESDKDRPGAGAAGGIGFAFSAFLGGVLKNGIGLILAETALEDYVRGADFVITGEGRLDSQTVMGKAPSGVADIAKKYSIPVLAFSGCVTREATICNEHGIDAFFPIVRGAVTLEETMASENAYRNLTDTAEQVFRLIKNARG
ncbi:MAG: glycerate kinase, partial [Clostridia bacterium]|nr:glycerate kinase [Clostridia bacterium]